MTTSIEMTPIESAILDLMSVEIEKTIALLSIQGIILEASLSWLKVTMNNDLDPKFLSMCYKLGFSLKTSEGEVILPPFAENYQIDERQLAGMQVSSIGKDVFVPIVRSPLQAIENMLTKFYK